MFWIVIIVAFAGVLRFVDIAEVNEVKDFIGTYIIQNQSEQKIECSALTGEVATGVLNHDEVLNRLDDIATKITVLENNFSPEEKNTEEPVSVGEDSTQKTYPTREALLKAEPNCKVATDGANNYFGEKLMASTLIGTPENFVPAWRCIDNKETVVSWKKLGEEKNDLSLEGLTEEETVLLKELLNKLQK